MNHFRPNKTSERSLTHVPTRTTTQNSQGATKRAAANEERKEGVYISSPFFYAGLETY